MLTENYSDRHIQVRKLRAAGYQGYQGYVRPKVRALLGIVQYLIPTNPDCNGEGLSGSEFSAIPYQPPGGGRLKFV